MHFDIWTLLASEVAVCLLLTLVMLLTAMNFRDVRGPRQIGLNFLCTALGIAVFMLRGSIPIQINVPLSNGLYCMSNALSYLGIAALLQVRTRLRFMLLIGALSTALLINFHGPDQTVLRIVIISMTDFLFRMNLFTVLMRNHRRGAVVRSLGICIGLFMLSDVLRTLATLRLGASAQVFQYNMVQSAYISTSLLLICAFGVFSLSLIAREVVSSVELRARRDSLTGVLNRLGIEEQLTAELERLHTTGVPFSIALLDVDNFKLFNDCDGHAAGDDVLRRVSSVISQNLRPYDSCGRLGGDEFLILLPGSTMAEARTLCHHVSVSLSSSAPYPLAGVAPTVSIGITTAIDQDAVKDILGRADRALYSAKRLGKNRIQEESARTGMVSREQAVLARTTRRAFRN